MKQNAQGLMMAKDRIEAVQNAFFKKEFSFAENGISMVMNGRYQLKSCESAEPIPADVIVLVQKGLFSLVKDDEMRGYCKVRNEVRAKFRIDIATSIPEVAEAVKHMERKQNAAIA